MDWIFDNFQILALVGLALASWLKSRSDAKAAEREAQEARRELAEPEEVFGPKESWTRPQPAPRPPLPPARSNTPPVPAFDKERELQRQLEIRERLRQIRESKGTANTNRNPGKERAKAGKATKPAAVAAPVSLRGALRHHGQVRRAIVMREILGPPLGLR